LQLSGEKMSKSLGNIISIDEFLSKHDADVFRMIVLNSSYRSPLTFTEDVIEQATRGLDRLRGALRPSRNGNTSQVGSNPDLNAGLTALSEQMTYSSQRFIEAMDDDFNTAGALSQLFELVRAINQTRDAGAGEETLKPAQVLLRELAGVLGLTLQEPKATSSANPFIELLVEIRTELRSQKLWGLSDLVRDNLKQLGVVLEDSKEGSTWRWE